MCDVFHFYVSMLYMSFTNLKKLLLLLLIISCNPCEDNGPGNDKSNYIFYQSNSQDNRSLIFRFEYENFKLREVSSSLDLGKSNNIDNSLIFNNDSIFVIENFTLNKKLVFENVPGIEVEKVFLNRDANSFLILSSDLTLYKSDLNNNVEFIDNNVKKSELNLFSNVFSYWKNDNKTIVLKNIQNSINVSKTYELDLENISDISLNQTQIVFSNFNDLKSMIYNLDYNLNIIDTTTIENGNIKPLIIGNEIYYFDDKNLFLESNSIYESNENESIVDVDFSSKSNIIYLKTLNNITNEYSIYYSFYNQVVGNFNLLINNASAVD